MVIKGLTVIFPPLEVVLKRFPPDEESNHLIVVAVVVALRFELLPQLIVEGDAVIDEGTGIPVIVIDTPLLVLMHPGRNQLIVT